MHAHQHMSKLNEILGGMFAEIDKEQLEQGVATMLRVATELLANQQKAGGRRWTSNWTTVINKKTKMILLKYRALCSAGC